MSIPFLIRTPDWSNAIDCSAVVDLLNDYAQDLMGGGAPLSASVQANLCTELSQRHAIEVLLAFLNDRPAGLCIAQEGFSTFACKPLLNIHDLCVRSHLRNQGIARALLKAMENIAVHRGCCKLTLEVLENNHAARNLYDAVGFAAYQLDPTAGKAMFLEKKLGQ